MKAVAKAYLRRGGTYYDSPTSDLNVLRRDEQLGMLGGLLGGLDGGRDGGCGSGTDTVHMEGPMVECGDDNAAGKFTDFDKLYNQI
ncbi:hypothetical protein DICVIV_13055 [Dictyocaulus viviparus]|uniref:Uncharacterized protein n=1 Tax=Dictyocaulus viviparus TaxID=29172 RepID=A0A0D8X8S3_DICVI|nr:hypothetical protein DICVIV_13055 [Dictyocaulus viviparus]